MPFMYCVYSVTNSNVNLTTVTYSMTCHW